MDFSILERYLLAKPHSAVYFPFGEEINVYKVKEKMFAILARGKMGKDDGTDNHWWLNLKCDPDEAVMLRDIFPSIIAGYHMNKRHWNTVIMDGSVPKGEIERMIDNSFLLVVNKMTKKDKQSIIPITLGK
ncbi:MAG: MmcQ/YjbR family DNA-binding protein [Psychrobium sp.]|nr:MmcQ/YjbR family DNA-binding protein [Psychrobium sp.]